jgi:hypothetical protein
MKRLLFLSALLAFSSVSSVQAKVITPSVSIQNGSVSIVWRAPSTQKYKVSVFINNTATATNAVYRVYPKGRSAQTTMCSSTDVNYPCFKFTINQASHQGKWVQLKINNNSATQWTFIQNTGFISLASGNISASEKLGVAGVNFIPQLPIKPTHDKWMRAIEAAIAVKNTISRCLNDNAGIKANCNSITNQWKLPKYGVSSLPAGTSTGDLQADWELMYIGNSGELNAAIIIRGGAILGKCRVALIPTVNGSAGVIKWSLSAKANAPALANDAECASFINAKVGQYVTYDYDTLTDPRIKMREKWQEAFKTTAPLRQAVSRCLDDNSIGNYTYDQYCKETTTIGLAKYGVNAFPPATADWQAVTMDYDPTHPATIIIQGQAPLGFCKMSLLPAINYSAGYIGWSVYAQAGVGSTVNDNFCSSVVKGSIPGAPPSDGIGAGDRWISSITSKQWSIRQKWQLAFQATATLRKAVSRCLNDNFGDIAKCNDLSYNELSKYGVTAFPVASDNFEMTTIETFTNWDSSKTTAIVIQGKAPVAYCKMSLVPHIDRAAGYISWHIYPESGNNTIADYNFCASIVDEITVSWVNSFNPDQAVRIGWTNTLTTLKSVKQAITQCLIDNNGWKARCNDVTIDEDKLQKYGISALPAGTEGSDGNAPDPLAEWRFMRMGKLGALNAAIIIRGGYSLAGCKITLQPTFDAGAKYVKWTYFAEAANFTLADTYKCSTFVNNAIAGAPY